MRQLEEGDKLVVREEAGRLVLEKRETVKQRLKARFNKVPKELSLADELIAERRGLGEIKIGVGTLVATNQRISKAINKSVNHLQNWINLSRPPLNIDETPWSVKGVKEWLWVFANPQFCLFRASDTRGRIELEDQLGTQYQGVIISDDFNVYNGYDVSSSLLQILVLLLNYELEKTSTVFFFLSNVIKTNFLLPVLSTV